MKKIRLKIVVTTTLLAFLVALWASTPQSLTHPTPLSPRKATAGWEGRWKWYGRQATVTLWDNGTLEWKVE